MVRGVGFEPTQAYASGSLHLAGKVLSPPPLAELGHPRTKESRVMGLICFNFKCAIHTHSIVTVSPRALKS